MISVTTSPAPIKLPIGQAPAEAPPFTAEPFPNEKQPTLPTRDPSKVPPPIVVPHQPDALPKLPPLRPGCR